MRAPASPASPECLEDVRSEAEAYERSLDAAQRKKLGQFFTGLPLSRLLAALSYVGSVATVADPMSGHGDLLDAVLERAHGGSSTPKRVDAVEIDPGTAGC